MSAEAKTARRAKANQKELLPVFVRSEVDELGLSLEAFRVYGHLARRMGNNETAWPSYASMGEACFRGSLPDAKPESLRRKAMRAVRELQKLGLIKVTSNKRGKMNRPNDYVVVKLSEWPADTLAKVRRPREE